MFTIHSTSDFPRCSQRYRIPIILCSHGRNSILIPRAQGLMARRQGRHNEMGMVFSFNVHILSDHDRPIGIFPFRNIPPTFSTDKSDRNAAYRTDNPVQPAHSCLEQRRSMSGISDLVHRETCRSDDSCDGNHRINVTTHSRLKPEDVHVWNSPFSS